MHSIEPYKVKSYYIAYFDILGYKAFFENQENDIIEFLHNVVNMAADVINKTDSNHIMYSEPFKIKTFSDNFIIMLEERDDYDEYECLKSIGYVLARLQLRFLQKYSILIRGGITKGQTFINNDIVFEEGLIRAVSLEENANFPRIVLDSYCFSKEICDSLCKKCVAEDVDEKYYIDMYSVLGSQVYYDSEFIDEDIHITVLRDNLIRLLRKNGKYNRKVTDPNKIYATEKTISKYLWVLTKYNDYCKVFGFDKYLIEYNLELYPKLMKAEIILR
ncbi:MAG: hypothetical protein J1F23_07680 [Oscillospiraceae bacterium]|nr:hypothetical protein [Oscillospiraceae bacterium]